MIFFYSDFEEDIKNNPEQLSHYDYHWFWGLRYSKVSKTVNLKTQLDYLMQNNKIDNLRETVREIEQKPWFFRIFYWFFNIWGYAFYQWVLTAMKINYTAYAITNSVTRFGITPPLTQCLAPAPRKNNQTDSINTDQQLFVTLDILNDLNQLGIEANVGDYISLQRIKTNYRKQARKYHPDKNLNTKTDFIFQEIYKSYSKLINQNASDSVDYDIELSKLKEAFKRLSLRCTEQFHSLKTYSEQEHQKLEVKYERLLHEHQEIKSQFARENQETRKDNQVLKTQIQEISAMLIQNGLLNQTPNTEVGDEIRTKNLKS